MKNTKRGLTLLELTVVVLILLSLLCILFIGARAFHKSNNGAWCEQNQIQYENAVRKYRACHDLGTGAIIDFERILIHDGIDPKDFKCPQGGTYSYSTFVQPTGQSSIECSLHKKSKVEAEGK